MARKKPDNNKDLLGGLTKMKKIKISQNLSESEIVNYCAKNNYTLIFVEKKGNETILNVVESI